MYIGPKICCKSDFKLLQKNNICCPAVVAGEADAFTKLRRSRNRRQMQIQKQKQMQMQERKAKIEIKSLGAVVSFRDFFNCKSADNMKIKKPKNQEV